MSGGDGGVIRSVVELYVYNKPWEERSWSELESCRPEKPGKLRIVIRRARRTQEDPWQRHAMQTMS